MISMKCLIIVSYFIIEILLSEIFVSPDDSRKNYFIDFFLSNASLMTASTLYRSLQCSLRGIESASGGASTPDMKLIQHFIR